MLCFITHPPPTWHYELFVCLRLNLADGVKAMGTLGQSVPKPAGDENPENEKKQKVKPMSKQLTSRIQGCAQRLTDIMSWQAKLDSSPLRLDTVWLYCLNVHVFFPYICAIAVWGKGQPIYIYI